MTSKPQTTNRSASDKRRRQIADSKADSIAGRMELGHLPAPYDQARRIRCAEDLLDYGYTYHAHAGGLLGANARPPSAIVREYVRRLQVVIREGGHGAVALPRGYGKTTWAKIAVMWAASYGYCDYSVVFGANQGKADDVVRDIKDQWEQNEVLAEDFPEICIPVQRLEGKTQRCAGQTHLGVRTRIEWGKDRLTLPKIEGSAAAGAIILGRGITSGFAGLVRGSRRPKFALADDVQTPETAASAAETAKLERAIQVNVMGLGGHDRPIGVLMACTVIEDGDLSDRFLDPSLHPEFQPVRSRFVLAWPTRADLWEQYADLWKQDQRDGRQDLPASAPFYAENREAMDAGAEVSDAELYDRRFEVSAIQHAHNLRLKMGAEAFAAQMDNHPLRASTMGYEINVKTVAMRVNGLKRSESPAGCRSVVAFSDVGFDAIRWGVLAYSNGQVTAVLDYGKEPSRGMLVPRNCSELETQKRIYAGLKAVHAHLESLPVSLRAWGIDRGFKPDTVHDFARNTRSRFAVMPVKGYGSSQYRADSKATVGEPGYFCHLTETAIGQYLAVQTDHWKETAQRAFLADPLSPGSCSFWGKSHVNHWEFAEHVCSEQLADKAVGPRGITFWRFTKRPGAANHYLDVLVGCFALLAWYRMFSSDSARPGVPVRRVVRKYVERRKCRVTMED